MESIDIDTLKRSCKANGLSDQGTKAELWGRLKCGSGADKKKAKKPAPPAADAGPPPSYVAKEYASLKTAGFDDENEINELINKRWKKAQELSVASVETKEEIVKATKNVIQEEVHIPVFLTEAQAAKSNLQIKDPQPNDKGMYIYTRISGSAAKDPKANTKAVRVAQAALAEAVKITSPSAETDAAPDPPRKRKWNFEQMDGFHEAAISWTSKTIENRLMDKKRQKQNLVNLCPDFNIPVVEDTKKRQIAQELARNLLHYTDDEEE